MSIIKVSVAGITGKFARLLMTHLLSHENVEIHGICRTPSKVAAEFTNDPRTKIFEASMTDKEKIEEAIKGTDICVCCYLGDESVMLDGQKLLIDACISQNVPRFMDSGYTFDYRGLEMGDAPQKDFCKKIQAYLDERKDRIRGVQILNGAFTEVVFAPFYGLFDANKRSVSYWGSGDEKVEMTTYDDAAKFAAEVAVDKKAVGYQSGEYRTQVAHDILMLDSSRRSEKCQRDCCEYRRGVWSQGRADSARKSGTATFGDGSSDGQGTTERVLVDGYELYLPWLQWLNLPASESRHVSLLEPEGC